MDTQKGANCGKIQSMGTSHYFIARQVSLIGVSDYCVKKKLMPCSHEYICLKPYGLDSISCTGFIRVMGCKYLLSADHASLTSLSADTE